MKVLVLCASKSLTYTFAKRLCSKIKTLSNNTFEYTLVHNDDNWIKTDQEVIDNKYKLIKDIYNIDLDDLDYDIIIDEHCPYNVGQQHIKDIVINNKKRPFYFINVKERTLPNEEYIDPTPRYLFDNQTGMPLPYYQTEEEYIDPNPRVNISIIQQIKQGGVFFNQQTWNVYKLI